ncbi:MAG: M24 family metallopeptidase [Alphaproteobacteria bacterium]
MTLQDLQAQLKKQKLDAYYIPRNTIFLEQDLLDEENLLLQLTGFSGSAGKMILTPEKAHLFVDGRYDIQAQLEVNPLEVQVHSVSEFTDFLTELETNNKNFRIGFNPWTSSIKEIPLFKAAKSTTSYIEKVLIEAKCNKKPVVFEHETEYAGLSREEKISEVVARINVVGYDAYFTTLADNTSWLLNLRSDYLPTSPIFRGYALIEKNSYVTIFSDDISQEEFSDFKIISMEKISTEFKKLSKKTLEINKESTPYFLKSVFEKNRISTKNGYDYIAELKSQKNEVEIKSTQKAHLKDGVAVTKFLYWFEKNALGKTELDIVEKLYEFRKQQDLFFSNSFETIAAFGSNGAIVHYQPTPKSNKKIENNNLFLLDSGGQYFDGTTDVTRTIVVGEINEEMKHDYTLVLKSHIALATASFPEKINGGTIDALAREPLWAEGKDYKHGTGHGVGFFLNVHEGPQSISSVYRYAPMKENVVISIEPGYYLEGKYGIRHENLYRVVKIEDKNFEKTILSFESLTLIPFDIKGIDDKMLSNKEKEWLNNYQQKVCVALSPFLTEQENNWLINFCKN